MEVFIQNHDKANNYSPNIEKEHENTQEILDHLITLAKASERLRISMDLRMSAEDQSSRIQNTEELNSPFPIHRHRSSAER